MKKLRLAALLILVMPTLMVAHHGSGISYDTAHMWTTWATMTTFNFKNPHPSLTWDRKTKDGKVEHWVGEHGGAPSTLTRAGWSRQRCAEELKAGTRVKLWLSTARVGGMSAIVRRIENEKGEQILGGQGQAAPGEGPKAEDFDGVPMGRQPTEEEKKATPLPD